MPRCRAAPDTKNPQRLHHGISDSRHWSSLHEFAAADAAVVVKLRKVAAVVEPEFARRDVAGHHQLHVRIRRLELGRRRSEEHTSELQSLMRISYAVFCSKTKNVIRH